jgi:hypothetical protein
MHTDNIRWEVWFEVDRAPFDEVSDVSFASQSERCRDWAQRGPALVPSQPRHQVSEESPQGSGAYRGDAMIERLTLLASARDEQ